MRLFLIVFFLLAVGTARSQADEIVDVCAGKLKSTPERTISACTILLSADVPEIRGYARAFRGIAYFEKRDFKAAIADLDYAVAHGKTGAFVYFYRGIAHDSNGDRDQALADLTRAVALSPNNPAPYYSRGVVYGNVRDWVRAIEDFSRVVILDPNSRDAYYLRAMAYELAGLDERALADYSKMIELNPSDIDAYVERRIVNHRLGKFDAAAADAGALRFLASKSETPSPTTTVVQPYTGEVYVLDCMLRDGNSVPGYMHAREAGKPADYNYSLLQRDAKTGYCKDDVAAQHRRNVLANAEALKRKRELELEEARRIGASAVTASRSPAEMPRSYEMEDAGRDDPYDRLGRPIDDLFAAGKPIPRSKEPEYTSRLRAPAYIPGSPSGVVTHMDAETYRRTTPRAPSGINNMDTRYSPYETTSEALHGRGKRYDPYATQDSWAYDRANPYAIAPQYKYGVTNPWSPSGTYYNPSTTLGGGPQPNNWQTNRYAPYGTQSRSTPMSGLNQVPLVPLNPPSNCPRQPTSILNSNAKQC